MTTKMAKIGKGTVHSITALVSRNSTEISDAPLTCVDLGDTETLSWHWRRVGVEALQPVAHGVLDIAVIPEDVQQRCSSSALSSLSLCRFHLSAMTRNQDWKKQH
jgi:hypothetical protein